MSSKTNTTNVSLASSIVLPVSPNLSGAQLMQLRCLAGLLSGWEGTLMTNLRRKDKLVYSVMCGVCGAAGMQKSLQVRTSFPPERHAEGMQRTLKLIGDWRVGAFDAPKLQRAKAAFAMNARRARDATLAGRLVQMHMGEPAADIEASVRAVDDLDLASARQLLRDTAFKMQGFVQSTVVA